MPLREVQPLLAWLKGLYWHGKSSKPAARHFRCIGIETGSNSVVAGMDGVMVVKAVFRSQERQLTVATSPQVASHLHLLNDKK
jgi:hypothetical protein